MSASSTKWKGVWALVTRGDQVAWTRVGVAWQGANGAVFARLSAVPLSGEICIRDWGFPMDGSGEEEGGAPPQRPEGMNEVPAAARATVDAAVDAAVEAAIRAALEAAVEAECICEAQWTQAEGWLS